MFNNNDNFDEIISILNEGKIILYPTDTIWGIGCDSMNTESAKRINKIRKKMPEAAMILLVSDLEMLKTYVKEIHPRIETLLAYHERPLTVLYKAKKNVPDIYIENNKVAIRIVKETSISLLIKKFGRPIVGATACIEGEDFPRNFQEINASIKSSVDYIFNLKTEVAETGEPSVIASFSKNGKLKFLR